MEVATLMNLKLCKIYSTRNSVIKEKMSNPIGPTSEEEEQEQEDLNSTKRQNVPSTIPYHARGYEL